MSQQQLPTPVSVRAKPATGLARNEFGDRDNMVDLLDKTVPLQGASHADVAEYCVAAPMRFAECLALLADGRKVGLRNPCQFVGWSGQSLLFSSGGKLFEVAIKSDSQDPAPGRIRVVFLEDDAERRSSFARKFIGIDGELVDLPMLAGTA